MNASCTQQSDAGTLGRPPRLGQNSSVIYIDAPLPTHSELAFVSEEDRCQSLERMLERWNGRDAIWVFAYGSLIWNPDLDYDAKHCGIVHGYHRSLCMWSKVYRGTPEKPGLVLALDRGGCCQGVAYRLPATNVRRELTKLWKRELVTGAYEPRWLRVRPSGPCARSSTPHEDLDALGFVIRRDGQGYAGKLDEATLFDTLCHARGLNGSSAEYLFATVESLAAHGLEDQRLASLADALTERLAGSR